jgi:glycosyltransferase involved in cell wall biosynthesis
MSLAVVTEVRFCRVLDGTVWAQASPYEFWSRYLDEFDAVTIVGREEPLDFPAPGMARVDGPGVTVRAVPHYLGTRGLVMRWREVRRAVRPVVRAPDALILRLGSLLALGLESSLLKSRRPYAVEVVGDPWDTFAPGVVDVPMRAVVRRVLTRSQQRLCAAAAGAAYVTERALQRRYPCMRAAGRRLASEGSLPFTTSYSSIELTASDFVPRPRVFDASRPVKILTVASLAQRYKGVDVLIRAVRAINDAGHSCQLTVVGDGAYRGELESLAQSLMVPVRFMAHLAKPDVVTELDRADLFVLASRTEGLPRAVIEAMARGLPCLGSEVGGIPELLDSRALCRPGSVESLVERLRDLMTGRIDANELAAANLQRAGDFRAEVLRARRRAFYRHVRLVTENWRQARTA